ncbi:hypothetical protein F4861DRAFT_508246 [Xylaria intraflava]|nr:hypothetical protein F4861DRAFT_508246 [Xylaria intraflava]
MMKFSITIRSFHSSFTRAYVEADEGLILPWMSDLDYSQSLVNRRYSVQEANGLIIGTHSRTRHCIHRRSLPKCICYSPVPEESPVRQLD